MYTRSVLTRQGWGGGHTKRVVMVRYGTPAAAAEEVVGKESKTDGRTNSNNIIVARGREDDELFFCTYRYITKKSGR